MPDYRHLRPLTHYRTPLPDVDYEELQGKLIVVEGPDGVGRSTQAKMLKPWLEELGHAVLDTGMARSALAGKGIKEAKEGNTLGPITMTLYYMTDFADRLENEIIPALRAGFVVLTDRYIFSIMARAIARGELKSWIERAAGFALVPHAVFYLRADVKDLVKRVVLGKGTFDYWESGLDIRYGQDLYESFVHYQTRLLRVFDQMAEPYGFTTIDSSKPAEEVFEALKSSILEIFREPEIDSGDARDSGANSRLRTGGASKSEEPEPEVTTEKAEGHDSALEDTSENAAVDGPARIVNGSAERAGFRTGDDASEAEETCGEKASRNAAISEN